jgi:putative membrane-bound dehydrogenase-like protein
MSAVAGICLGFVGLLVSVDPPPAPLSATEAPLQMTLPPGFRATLFAGEPDVVQPIATAFDDRGRLWVAECLSYPNWVSDPKEGRDRIIIFEDQNGDGKYSKKTVFATNIQNISGLELGFGGVWVCSSPNLLFIPTDPSGDKPVGPPQIVLDGWDIETAQHNVFNRIVFGPDGWLYGCNGIQSKSLVGRPGTPFLNRTPINCGVWRYHPTRKIFEVVAHGTTNPWGLDFDDYGEMFITNCVIEHIFHVVPGAHFKRMYGEDFDKRVYGLMPSCADHIHWAGGFWKDSFSGAAHSDAGGGHAHAGCMVYLGDNWPDEYRNNAFMCNIHGNRINRDILELKGSGYVARHGKDFLLANDPWFRGLNLIYGPDGGVFVQDWTDTGECHNYKTVDRTNGRLYKVVYGPQPKPMQFDIAKLSDEELVKMQLHKNDYFVRRARLQLAERAVKRKVSSSARLMLAEILKCDDEVARRLRALWCLHLIGDTSAVRFALASSKPQVKAWGVRLMAENPSAIVGAPERLAVAADDKSPSVRMAVASAAQRFSVADRKEAVRELIYNAEDTGDQSLSWMIWYAAAPVMEKADLAELSQSLLAINQPLVRENSIRLHAERDPRVVVQVSNFILAMTKRDLSPAIPDVLRGAHLALKDVRLSTPPQDWKELAARLSRDDRSEVRLRTILLSLQFGEASAKSLAQMLAADASAPTSDRREAFAALVRFRPEGLFPFLLERLGDPHLCDLAIRGLGSTNDPQGPRLLIERYSGLTDANKREALAVLASRPEWGRALLKAVKEGRFPKHDVDSVIVRQLLSLKDKSIQAEVESLWGRVRGTAQDKKNLMTQYRAELPPNALQQANLSNGRAVFVKNCGQCHTLFDAGGKLGPDLTGSQRANLDYVLENVLDPSAIVASEYLMTIVQTADGRTLNGVVVEETPAGLTLKTPTENIRLQKSEIEKRSLTSQSIMPENVFQQLSPTDRRDLVAYLASQKQAPLPSAN